MTDERRGSPRHAASLAGELETADGASAIAITRDVSAGGLLLYTRLPQCSGELKLKVIRHGETMELTGKVVRTEPVEDSTLWRTKIAISVDPDDPVLSKLVSALQSAADEPS